MSYIYEKYFKHPRHIEVQVMSGKIKRFILVKEIVQSKEGIKLIEETPSPVLTNETKEKIY